MDGQEKTNLVASLPIPSQGFFFVLIFLSLTLSFILQVHTLWLLDFVFLWDSKEVHEQMDLSIYLFLVRFLGLFSFACLFVLSYYRVCASFYFIRFYFIPQLTVCFLVRDRKGVDPNEKESGEELERLEGGKPYSEYNI